MKKKTRLVLFTKGLLMKERLTITIDKELLRWLDKKVAEKIFANRSHGLEFLAKKLMIIEKKSEIERIKRL